MKRLLTLLFLSFQFVAFAQSYFWSHASGQKVYPNDLEIVNDTLIFATYRDNISCPEGNFLAFSTDGELLWNQKNPGLVHVGKDAYYTQRHAPGNDYPHAHFTISKYDFDHNLISESNTDMYGQMFYNMSKEWFYTTPDHFIGDTLGNLLLVAKNDVLKLDHNGEFIFLKNLVDEDSIKHIQFINPSSLVYNTNNKVYIADSSFVNIQHIAFDSKIMSSTLYNDTIYALLSDKLVRLNLSLDIIDTIISEQNNIHYENMRFSDGKLYVQGTKEGFIHVLETHNEIILHNHVFEYLVSNIKFAVNKNQFVFSGITPLDEFGVYTYNLNVEPEEIVLSDIELLGFNQTLIDIESLGYWPHWAYNFDLELIIKNNGTTPLTSFSLFCYTLGGINCGRSFHFFTFSDFELAPGEQTTIDTTLRYFYFVDQLEICHTVIAPNGTIETEINNNKDCKRIIITNTTNTSSTKKSLELYPNPASDQLMIKTDKRISSISITNTTGNVIISTIANSADAVIDVAALSKGIYILSVNTDEGVIREKFVKE